jgi:hypothetical protein
MEFKIESQRTVEYNNIIIEITKDDIATLLKYGEIRQYNEALEKLLKNNITIKLIETKKE